MKVLAKESGVSARMINCGCSEGHIAVAVKTENPCLVSADVKNKRPRCTDERKPDKK